MSSCHTVVGSLLLFLQCFWCQSVCFLHLFSPITAILTVKNALVLCASPNIMSIGISLTKKIVGSICCSFTPCTIICMHHFAKEAFSISLCLICHVTMLTSGALVCLSGHFRFRQLHILVTYWSTSRCICGQKYLSQITLSVRFTPGCPSSSCSSLKIS